MTCCLSEVAEMHGPIYPAMASRSCGSAESFFNTLKQ